MVTQKTWSVVIGCCHPLNFGLANMVTIDFLDASARPQVTFKPACKLLISTPWWSMPYMGPVCLLCVFACVLPAHREAHQQSASAAHKPRLLIQSSSVKSYNLQKRY